MLMIEGLLDRSRLAELNQLLGQMRFAPGHETGGTGGQLVKNNLQPDPQDPNYPRAAGLVLQAINASAQMHAYTMASKLTPIVFGRYGPGMTYGDHVDAAVHSLPNMIVRTDISFTIFLSGPDEYDGGELTINIEGAEMTVKGKAGDAFIYPTGVMHRVNPVTQGWRAVAVGWIQSLVPSHEHREILYKLGIVRERILRSGGYSEEFALMNSAYENLLRLCVRP